MSSIFTRILRGELPGRFVWSDPRCVGMLTIGPITRGHTLVVPREEIDHWIDVPEDLAAHLMRVAHAIGRGVRAAFGAPRVGLIIAGFEVPHTHLHVIGMRSMRDLDFANAERNPEATSLDAAAQELRVALRRLGYAQVSERV